MALSSYQSAVKNEQRRYQGLMNPNNSVLGRNMNPMNSFGMDDSYGSAYATLSYLQQQNDLLRLENQVLKVRTKAEQEAEARIRAEMEAKTRAKLEAEQKAKQEAQAAAEAAARAKAEEEQRQKDTMADHADDSFKDFMKEEDGEDQQGDADYEDSANALAGAIGWNRKEIETKADSAVKQLTEAIDALKAEIAEMQVQMKRAGEDREKENKEFQMTVADQRATQKLLTAALNVLKGFYEKKAKAALLQTGQPAGPPPPPGFEAYKKNAAAGGVMGMIQQIINDAKAMEAEVIRSEEDAQKAYEDFVKDTNGSIEEKSKDIVNKSETKAKAEADLVEAKENKEAVMLELEQLANYKAELHSSCDFVMKNFEIRQTARDEEIEALKQAKAILSGAKFEAFLQSA